MPQESGTGNKAYDRERGSDIVVESRESDGGVRRREF
jgi:hypothetical protein